MFLLLRRRLYASRSPLERHDSEHPQIAVTLTSTPDVPFIPLLCVTGCSIRRHGGRAELSQSGRLGRRGDVEGRTALHFAAANGHLEVLELLLKKDADPNITNEQGNTALHWACVNGHGEAATRLLAAGAKTTLVNAGGRTALDEAMHNDRQACVDAIITASGVEEEEEDDVEVEGEEAEDQGPETEADR